MGPGTKTPMLVGLLTTLLLFSLFCNGYLHEINQDHTGIQDSITGTNGTTPIVCYFSFDRKWPDNGTLHPALNATLCTHINFISTTTKDGKIALGELSDGTKYLEKVPLLRKQNPKLKLLVCHGGGFNTILASAANRTRFVESILPFLQKYDLDGLDIDWEYPGRNQRQSYAIIMQEFRNTFNKETARTGRKYYLTAAVAPYRSLLKIYNIPALARAVDWINMMNYDYHAYSKHFPFTDYNSPLYPTDWGKRPGNTGLSAYEWHRRGMPKPKILVGIPQYGHTYTLKNPTKSHGRLAPASGPGKSCNECGYSWVCDFIKSGATVVFDEDAYVPYAYKGNQWISYDNEKSSKRKAKFVLDEGYGGVMAYSMNNDDYLGLCGTGKFPLISAIKQEINNKAGANPDEDVLKFVPFPVQ